MPTNSNSARVIIHDRFDGTGFTNEQSMVNALLTKPDKINPVLTQLAGDESKKFPMTFLTEGQSGGVKPIELNDIQYEWDVIRRMKKSDAIVSTTYGATDRPGLNATLFYVIFETNWLKDQHMLISPHGIQAQIKGKPTNSGTNYLYALQIADPNPLVFCPVTELAAGVRWSMIGGAPVSQSLSMGNESNMMTPGKMKNQISILRKSFHWGGNIANKMVECQFNIEGQTTSLWMTYERWQHTIQWKEVCEEHYWEAKYNRNAQGVIVNKDKYNGLPIPIGAGVYDQIPNQDTYSVLTAKKLKNTVGDVMYQTTDAPDQAMDIILYTGLGGLDEFDQAMKTETKNFTQIIGDKFISGAGRNLRMGGFFTQYEHIDGHVITVKHLRLLDYGGRAENAPKHPRTGKPLTSHEMHFIDQSTYGGVRNVQMCTEKGRGMRTGIVKGMATIPTDFGGNSSEFDVIADEQDKASVHYLSAKGICINRNTNCFSLFCTAS